MVRHGRQSHVAEKGMLATGQQCGQLSKWLQTEVTKQVEIPGGSSAYWSRDPGQGGCDALGSTAHSRLQKHQECRFPSNSALVVSLSHLSIPHGTPGTKGEDPAGRQGFLSSWLESCTGILQRKDGSLPKPWGPACS